MERMERWVAGLSYGAAKELLITLIEELDACDESDLLGTEGWRHFFQLSDRIPTAE